MFDSNVPIGDEIKYVMDRQNQENRMGNTLERPSLLNKKNFIRNTTTEEEKVKAAGKNAEAKEQTQSTAYGRDYMRRMAPGGYGSSSS